MAEFVLRVHDIDETGKDFDFPVSDSWIAEALSDTPIRPGGEGGRLRVHAQKNGNDYLVMGRLRAGLRVECVRCLEDVNLGVDADVTALFSPRSGRALPREMELEQEDLDRLEFDGIELVLDPLVREQLVLEVPMQPLCSADCKGLEVPEHLKPRQEDFGGAGGIDPRLAPLRALKDKLSESEE